MSVTVLRGEAMPGPLPALCRRLGVGRGGLLWCGQVWHWRALLGCRLGSLGEPSSPRVPCDVVGTEKGPLQGRCLLAAHTGSVAY